MLYHYEPAAAIVSQRRTGESIADRPDSKKDFRSYHCSASFAHHCLQDRSGATPHQRARLLRARP
jgi:hypothetical protein